ncbi:MAG: amino acid synthesis family protein [Gammaproteobacteria bacterium]
MTTSPQPPLVIRKWFSLTEETQTNESGQPADGLPLYKFVLAACVRNPYAGRFSQDLSAIVEPSQALGEMFGQRIQSLAADQPIESYGKGCIVGMAGEYEHGNAFLTNIGAGPVRDAVGGGKAWVPSTGKRATAGSSIDIPLAHKDALYVRSHYDTISVSFSDCPAADEVLIVWAFATRGRLHARLGGLQASDVKGEDGLF